MKWVAEMISVVSVGLPDEGVSGVVDRFTAGNPGFVELSERAFRSSAIASGLEDHEMLVSRGQRIMRFA